MDLTREASTCTACVRFRQTARHRGKEYYFQLQQKVAIPFRKFLQDAASQHFWLEVKCSPPSFVARLARALFCYISCTFTTHGRLGFLDFFHEFSYVEQPCERKLRGIGCRRRRVCPSARSRAATVLTPSVPCTTMPSQQIAQEDQLCSPRCFFAREDPWFKRLRGLVTRSCLPWVTLSPTHHCRVSISRCLNVLHAFARRLVGSAVSTPRRHP